MPSNGSLRRFPLFAPVIDTSTTGSPASSVGTDLCRLVLPITARSIVFNVLLKNQAPSADPDTFCMARCTPLGVGTS